MSLDALYSKLSLSDTHEDLYRNIVSLRESEDLFDDLSPDPTDWSTAIEAEMISKQSGFISQNPIIDRPFEEAKWFNSIGFPFSNWMESRYSNGKYGVWYGGESLETTIYETVHHWTEFLSDAQNLNPGRIQERRIHTVRCDALLVDIRHLVPEFPGLISTDDYSLTQSVGSRLQGEEHPGLLAKSARCSGDVYALFNPKVLSNPRMFCYLTYKVGDQGTVEVEREPGKLLLSVPYIND